MNNRYKYKISKRKLLSSLYITIMVTIIPISSLFRLVKNTLNGRDLILMTLLFIFGIIIFVWVLLDFVNEVLHFRENRRNPNIIVDDESITLPFEDKKKRVQLSFTDIKECKEAWITIKKKKNFFIYLSSKCNNEDYRLYKENMNAEEYNELKNYLLKRVNNRNK